MNKSENKVNENMKENKILEEKPSSSNKFVAFFQNIGKSYMKSWHGFCEKHPKGSKLIYQIWMFWVFSMMVTIFQFLVFQFLPLAFGENLASTEWLWPSVDIDLFGVSYKWSLLGTPILYNSESVAIIGGGLGYFISYAIGTFLAQVINFPLQRNITFKSKGNVYYQIMWYFIAWILITLICTGINNLWVPLFNHALQGLEAIANIIVTFITGGVSMVIFFFVFKIIFPEVEKKKD